MMTRYSPDINMSSPLDLNLNLNSLDDYDNISYVDSVYLTVDEINDFLNVSNNNLSLNVKINNFWFLNCRSLSKNFDSLTNLLSQINQSFTCIALAETWLKQNHEDLFQLPGYSIVSNCRENKIGGGVCLYICQNEEYKVMPQLTIMTEHIETIFVEIINTNSTNMVVGCVYRPPSASGDIFNDTMTSLLRMLCSAKNKDIYIMGDYNFDLLKFEQNTLTGNFLQNMLSYSLHPIITRATRITENSKTLIDNIFTNACSDDCKSAVIYSDISDHLPCILQCRKRTNNDSLNEAKSSPPNISRNFSKASIAKFNHHLSHLNWAFLYNGSGEIDGDPNIAYNNFLDTLTIGLDTFFPQTVKQSYRKTPRKAWITPGLVKSCETKCKLYKRFIEENTDETKLAYNAYKNKLKHLLRKAEKDYFCTKLHDCDKNMKKTWQVLNGVLNRASNKATSQQNLNVNGVVTSDFKCISEGFNDYFVNVGSNLAKNIPPVNHSFEKYLSNPQRMVNSCSLHPTSPMEIINLVKALSNSHSSSFDEISTSLLKNIIHPIAQPLADIINCCLDKGIFPDKMKIAKVIPIFKTGKKTDIKNYRPISILPAISKIFEKLIEQRITSFIERFNIVASSQFGFRKKHSTQMAILSLYEKVTEALDNNEFAIGIFVDLSKAFDTLNHKILINKLEYYGIRGVPLALIKSYLHNRTQYVSYHNYLSCHQPITCGVPQGSVLGPLLFTLYINDIEHACPELNFILFADDTNLMYSNKDIWTLKRIVNNQLASLANWFKANKLSLNISKTSYILFGRKKINTIPDNAETFTIQIEDQILSQVNHTKFLGVVVDQKLSWKQHVEHLCLKISKSIGMINRIKFKLNRNALILLYKTLIYPHLSYCNIIWGTASQSALKQLTILQKRIVRIITHSYYLAHTSPLFHELKLLKLADLNNYVTGIFIYKYINNLLPSVCRSLITLNPLPQAQYSLRRPNSFNIPTPRTTLRQNCLRIRGPTYWNSLPPYIQQSSSIMLLKSNLTFYLISNYK